MYATVQEMMSSLSRLSGGKAHQSLPCATSQSLSRLSGGKGVLRVAPPSGGSLSRLSGGKGDHPCCLCRGSSLSRLSGGKDFLFKEKRKHYNTLRCIFDYNHIFKERSQVIVIPQIYQKAPKDPQKFPG